MQTLICVYFVCVSVKIDNIYRFIKISLASEETNKNSKNTLFCSNKVELDTWQLARKRGYDVLSIYKSEPTRTT